MTRRFLTWRLYQPVLRRQGTYARELPPLQQAAGRLSRMGQIAFTPGRNHLHRKTALSVIDQWPVSLARLTRQLRYRPLRPLRRHRNPRMNRDAITPANLQRTLQNGVSWQTLLRSCEELHGGKRFLATGYIASTGLLLPLGGPRFRFRNGEIRGLISLNSTALGTYRGLRTRGFTPGHSTTWCSRGPARLSPMARPWTETPAS